MGSATTAVSNVIRFSSKRAGCHPHQVPVGLDRKAFLDVVHACGALLLAGDNRESRAHAVRFSILGLVSIEELSEDGSSRRLRPSEAFFDDSRLPWRVAKLSESSSVSLAPSAGISLAGGFGSVALSVQGTEGLEPQPAV